MDASEASMYIEQTTTKFYCRSFLCDVSKSFFISLLLNFKFTFSSKYIDVINLSIEGIKILGKSRNSIHQSHSCIDKLIPNLLNLVFWQYVNCLIFSPSFLTTCWGRACQWCVWQTLSSTRRSDGRRRLWRKTYPGFSSYWCRPCSVDVLREKLADARVSTALLLHT